MRILRGFLLCLSIIIASTTLAGCGDSNAGDIAIVIGAHANNPQPKLTDAALEELNPTFGSDSRHSLITTDANPESAGTFDSQINDTNDLTEKKSLEELVAKLVADVEAARADDPESDLIAAIDLGARAVASSDGTRTVLVLDSGLQTSGTLRFQDHGGALLSADPETIATQIADELPDLTGVKVIFLGLGDVVEPQQPLSPSERRRLIAIWEAVVRKAGGTPMILPSPVSGPSQSGLPAVSPVPTGEPSLSLNQPVSLMDDVTGFVPNKAIFLDPSLTYSALQVYADAIIASGERVVLTGTTTSDQTEEFRLTLSRERAQAVKEVLVELGVSEDRIRVDGVGTNFAEFVPDRDSQGEIDERIAAGNRRVIMTIDR